MIWAKKSRSDRDYRTEPPAESEQPPFARPPGKRTLVGTRLSAQSVVQRLEGARLRARNPGSAAALSSLRAVQMRLISPSEIRERWEDATMGLTARQALDLSTSLSWTAGIRGTASTRPAHLETLQAQAQSLLADLTAFAQGSEITSRAMAEAGPAVPKAISLQSLIEGAMKPVPEVRKEAGRILFGASSAMFGMRKPYLGPAGSAGSVELQSQAHLLDLIAQGRDSEDGLIPGTEISVETDEQEAQVRAKYMPLEDSSIGFLEGLSDEVDRIKEELQGSGPGGAGGRPLESVKAELEGLLFAWDQFSSSTRFSEVLLPKREKVRTGFDSAHKMVVGKLAPIENTMNLVVQMVSEIETAIRATLALPQRRDPELGDAEPAPMPHDDIFYMNPPEARMVPEQPRPEPVQHRRAGGLPGAARPEPALDERPESTGLWGSRREGDHDAAESPAAPRAPGKRTLVGPRFSTRRIARAADSLLRGGASLHHRRAEASRSQEGDELAVAARGVEAGGSSLPYHEQIQRAFGDHDVSDVRAHTGSEAAGANEQMGSLAYAMGSDVAFRDSSPDLFTAAHEAAHVVQQRAGAMRDGEVGEPGDALERHADQVAERVVRGESAQELLDQVAGPAPSPATGLSHRAVQHKPGAGVEIGPNQIKVALKVEPSRTIPCGKAQLTFAAPIEVAAELKSKAPPGPADASASDSGGKVSLTVYKREAKQAGEDALMNLVDEEMEPSGWQVEEVKWEGEGTGGENEAGNGQFQAATAVVIKFKNGQETSIKATLFGSEAGSGMHGPKAEIAHKFTVGQEKLWENEDAELSVSGTISIKLEVEPNWTQIFADLAAEYGKRGGLEIAKNFMRSTLQGLCGTAGFVAGGVVQIFSFGASMIDAQAVLDTIKAAKSAVNGYAAGYTYSWGMQDYAGATARQWFIQGNSDGATRLAARAREVIAHPAFAPWKFTVDEVTTEMKNVARGMGVASEVYNEVEATVQSRIYEGFVKKFYEQQNSAFWRPEYIARQNAEDVARALGVDADEVLPPPED